MSSPARSSSATLCFVARDDFLDKPGGDTEQYRVYAAAASAAGMQVVTWFDDRCMPPADVFHALNVDRPLELYPKLRLVAASGKPFVLSTIHHPIPWLERFRATSPPGGLAGAILHGNPLTRPVPVSESIKELVRILRKGDRRVLRSLWPSWTMRIRWLLANANRLLLLSPEELTYLEKDFQPNIDAGRISVVPNWVEGLEPDGPLPTHLDGWAEPPILVVARIEARKNVLRVARLAQRSQRPVLFVGRPNPNEPSYVREFTAVVESGPWVKWVPGVPRSTLAGYYRTAAFLLNASYVEVSPFVDIEALAFGCPVVTTRYAVHHSLLPSGTPQCDAYDDQDLRRVMAWRPTRGEPAQTQAAESCRALLLAAYEEALAQPPSPAWD